MVTIINEYSNSKTAAAAVIPDFPVEQGEVTVLHDLFAGGVAGSASVIVGHPFDTIKVRMQTSTASSLEGGRQSLGSTISKFGGVSSLFRGMTAPLSAAAGVNAIIFSSYGWSTRQWDIYMPPRPSNFAQRTLSSSTTGTAITLTDPLEEENKAVHDSTQKAFMCGSFAGLTQCLIICPSKYQSQHKGRSSHDHACVLGWCVLTLIMKLPNSHKGVHLFVLFYFVLTRTLQWNTSNAVYKSSMEGELLTIYILGP